MATVNPFDLLDDDVDDPSQLIEAQQQKLPAQAKKAPAPAATQQQQQPAKLPSKPLPPAQAVRESRAEGERGGGYGRGRGGGGGYGRGSGGSSGFNNNRESTNNSENAFGNRDFSRSSRGGTIEEADSTKPRESRGVIGGPPRTSNRGGRRGGFNNEEASDGEPPRRVFERRSGTGRGNEMKREGAGRGNWGTPTDEFSEVVDEVVIEGEKIPGTEKTDSVEADTTEGNKDIPVTEPEAKEPEEMTLEEYEKVLEEKRKALQSMKTEERKVDDKEFASMQQLTSKKTNGDDIFIKLGSEKDKKKENAEKEDRAKKALSINEFLKPAEGERYYAPGGGRGGRGRGRAGGRGGGGGYGGGENQTRNAEAPAIQDPGQFPSLNSK